MGAGPGRQPGGKFHHLVIQQRRPGFQRVGHGRDIQAAPSLDLLALDEALARLAETEPAKAELVKLRFFAGLTMPEAAATLRISLATAERSWTFAKSWLRAELADDA